MTEPYYDLSDDWSLIVSSFQTQYGIRLATELPNMGWREFSYMLEGLSGDTPLGRIVSIRAENAPDRLKQFTPEQRKIRTEYRKKVAKRKPKAEVERAYEGFKTALIKMAQQ